MTRRVTSVDARTLERAADLLTLLHSAERAFCLEDVHAMWSAFDQVDPVEVCRLEGELRERAGRAVELALPALADVVKPSSPLSESSPQGGTAPPTAVPPTLHSVKVASEEPVTPALCWWLMETAGLR